MRHSIWGMLDKESADTLRQTIRDLSIEHNTTSFEPHITVLGSIDGDEQRLLHWLNELGQSLRQYELHVSDVLEFDDKYRCVVLSIKPSFEVLQAHDTAKILFSESRENYFPHVSLLYAKLFDTKRREITDMLKKNVKRFPETILVTHLALYTTSGPHQEWREVGRVELKQK